MIFYNEFEPFAAQWLRNLSKSEEINPGTVSAADIRELGNVPEDCTQFHAFAGLGAWSLALDLAGFPRDTPVWTGSCPCQPFSTAGKRRGNDDPRHLWPEWRRLIEQHQPPIIFGEQVASPDGRAWLDDVQADLEALGYAVGAADLCAAGIGAPHARQRLFFGAVRMVDAKGWKRRLRASEVREELSRQARRRGLPIGLANADVQRCGGQRLLLREWAEGPEVPEVAECRKAVAERMANADGQRHEERGEVRQGGFEDVGGSPTSGFWGGADWMPCKDGKARPVEPGTHPLAYGPPNRVGALRAYGNAIVPQVAATFIQGFLEAAWLRSKS